MIRSYLRERDNVIVEVDLDLLTDSEKLGFKEVENVEIPDVIVAKTKEAEPTKVKPTDTKGVKPTDLD